jgi:hypothetical protein
MTTTSEKVAVTLMGYALQNGAEAAAQLVVSVTVGALASCCQVNCELAALAFPDRSVTLWEGESFSGFSGFFLGFEGL